jgi:hypothetical protein
VDPTDGTLYGTTGRAEAGGAPNPGSLITIDPETGAGTLVGDLSPGTETAGDITFTPDGTLYGWLLPSPPANDLATIDKTTGAASIVGESGLSTHGSGLASSPEGTLFHAALDDSPLWTIDRATGAATPIATLSGTEGFQFAALAFDAAGTLFGLHLEYSSAPPRPAELVTIDIATGVFTPRGPLVDSLDAIAFGQVQSERTVSFDATKAKKKKAAGKEPLLRVLKGKKARFSGQVSAPEDTTGCQANQTVELQRKKPSQATFTTVETLQTDAAGSFTTKERVKKTFQWRAFLTENPDCDDATSNSEKVKAKKKKR